MAQTHAQTTFRLAAARERKSIRMQQNARALAPGHELRVWRSLTHIGGEDKRHARLSVSRGRTATQDREQAEETDLRCRSAHEIRIGSPNRFL
jgi:hypothetical protein